MRPKLILLFFIKIISFFLDVMVELEVKQSQIEGIHI